MKLRALLAAAVVLGATALCASLGFWQLARWQEKLLLNLSLREADLTPPIEAKQPPPPEDVRARYLAITGRYDERRQILLGGRLRDEVPGADVITPLVLEDGSAILVNRGWIPIQAPESLRLGDYTEPGPRRVVGFAEPLRKGRRSAALATSGSDSETILWGQHLDLDTLSARLPYRLAPYALRQVPGPGAPAVPVRLRPALHDSDVHLGYAIQWFAFGLIVLGGSTWLAWQRKRAGRAAAPIPKPSRSG